MRAVNAAKSAKDLKTGDLWVQVLGEDEVEVRQVTEVKHVRATKTRKKSVHVTYDCLYQWANDASYTEGLNPDDAVPILVLSHED